MYYLFIFGKSEWKIGLTEDHASKEEVNGLSYSKNFLSS